VALVASSVYALASASATNAQAVIHNSMTKADARLSKDAAGAFGLVDGAKSDALNASGEEAMNIIRHAYNREIVSLTSVKEVIGNSAFQTLAEPVIGDWNSREQRVLAQIRQAVTSGMVATNKPASLGVKKLGPEIPVRNSQIRGPVNFFRTEYGRWWLIEKTGNEHFETLVPLAKYGHYLLYETLNFADGKRNVAEIRDAVSAEYEPVSVQDVEQYFRFLESVGVVRMKKNGERSQP